MNLSVTSDIVPGAFDVFRNARVLITGGLGFLGSNLARRLVCLGARVSIVDALVPEHGGSRFNIAGIAGRVEVSIGDINDTDALTCSVAGQQFLFDLAGQGSHWDSMVAPCRDLDSNCRGRLCLLECLRRTNPGIRTVFASTRQIYGRPEYLPVDEKHVLQPVDLNGVHKIAAENYYALYGKVYGLKATLLRLTNTIGPRMRVCDVRQTFLGLWIRCAIEKRPFEVWGGEQKRDFNYVDDVVDAFLLAAASDRAQGRTYNLGAHPPASLRQVADLLAEITGASYVVRPYPGERASIDIGDYYACYDRIREELGWQPRWSLRSALETTVAYYRRHLKHYV